MSLADSPTRGDADRLFTRAFGLLIGAQLLQSLGYASMILLPLYLEHLGANRAEIGVIMGAAAVGGLVFRPAVAWALDAVGRRPTIVVGTIVLVVGVAALGTVRALGPSLLVIRAVIGVGIGTLFTGYFTFAADHVPSGRRTEGLAIFGIFGLLGLLVNPLAEFAGVSGARLRTFFPLVALVIGCSLIPFAFVPEVGQRGRRGGASAFGFGVALRALASPTVRPVWWATAVFATLVATYMAFVTVAATGSGIPWPARIWLAYTGGAAFVRAFGARLPDRIGPANLVAPALALYAGAFVLAAHGGGQRAFMLSGLLAGLGHGYCFPVLTSQVVTRMPPTLTGSGMALFTGLWELMRLLLTPVFGVIADRFDDATMFAATAVFAAGGLAVWIVLEARWAPRPDTAGGPVAAG